MGSPGSGRDAILVAISGRSRTAHDAVLPRVAPGSRIVFRIYFRPGLRQDNLLAMTRSRRDMVVRRECSNWIVPVGRVSMRDGVAVCRTRRRFGGRAPRRAVHARRLRLAVVYLCFFML
jgi:hypothetical protein